MYGGQGGPPGAPLDVGTHGGAGMSRRGGQGGVPLVKRFLKKKKVDEVLKYNFPQKFGVITMIFIGIVGGPGLPRRGRPTGGAS